MMYPLSCHEEHIQFPYPFISPPRSLPGPPPGKSRDIFDPLKRRADSHGVLSWLLDARNNLRHLPELPPRRVWGRVLSMVPESARVRAKSDSDNLSGEFLRRREHQLELRRRLRDRHQELEREAQQNAPTQPGFRGVRTPEVPGEDPAKTRRPTGLLSLAMFLRKNGDLLRATRLRPTPRANIGDPQEDSDDERSPLHDVLNLSDPESYAFPNSDDDGCILRLGTRSNLPAECPGAPTRRKNSQGSTVSSSRSRGKGGSEQSVQKRNFLSPEDGPPRRGRGFLSNLRPTEARQESDERFVTAWSHNDEDGARLVVPSRLVSTLDDSAENGNGGSDRVRSDDSARSFPAERSRVARLAGTSEILGDNAPLSPLPRGYATSDRDRKKSALALDPRHLEKSVPSREATHSREASGRFQSLQASSRGTSYTPGDFGETADATANFPANDQYLRPLHHPFPLSHHGHHVSLPMFSRLPEHPFSPASACTPTQKVLPYTLKDLPDSPGPQTRPYRPANSKIRRGNTSVEKSRARDASTRRRRDGAGCSVSRRKPKPGRASAEKRKPLVPMYRQSPSQGIQPLERRPVQASEDFGSCDRLLEEWTEYRKFLEQRLHDGETREARGTAAHGYATRLESPASEARPLSGRLECLGSSSARSARGASGGSERCGPCCGTEEATRETGVSGKTSFCGWVMAGSSSSDGVGRFVGSVPRVDR
ncbi:hypothetical protein TGME49_229280 [Toxoplasma gondii ME49]|uniref:Uncharacterized protein n=3 Tax=Toxoplasma gondii TaxID=5811 RepID=B6KJ49_TOXGV|nr:hypothetical protein TGME49_229280 [Toxoplasma gondii ME49]EPT29104.1 hypothetical protein TGME49_229280 [Toxoplasma gondii ME49]ESS35540.1 hypothetical protein TGVEG_229280 [Toxoplasma gondii VEG]KYF45898.1 hypothetical protein TGARI_229280 [Toxoplasma gondii ARI]CEL74695.1 TPA: hypothetical protein BN1205_026120 [Toxoplasma gondii VEG]|eukprot:XP_002367872.1 hypothetical protein TGME49_229280 [Toxoplasma gondii ME49]